MYSNPCDGDGARYSIPSSGMYIPKINLNEEQIYTHIQNIAVILIKHTGEGPAQTYITNSMFYHFAICQDYGNPSSFVTRYKN